MGFDFWHGKEVLLFSITSIPALGFAQPLIHGTMGTEGCFPGGIAAEM
jgi:hypothetical protein